jgi:hypothetical protein
MFQNITEDLVLHQHYNEDVKSQKKEDVIGKKNLLNQM